MSEIEWFLVETADKTGSEPLLLFQDGNYSIGVWEDHSHEEQRSLGREGDLETYEWVKVEAGYWDTSGDIYSPTHWAILTPPK